MKTHLFALALVALLASGLAWSANGVPDSAASPGHKKGGACFVQTLGSLGGSVELKCDYLGKVSVPKIYESGWRVVASYFYPDHAVHTLIIEEQ